MGLVDFKILIKDKEPNFFDKIDKITITDDEGFLTDTLDISFFDNGFYVEYPERGDAIECLINGYSFGKFVIDELEITSENLTTIRAKGFDSTGKLKEIKSRSFEDKNFGDVIRTICKEHKLIARVEKSLEPEEIKETQFHESDINFIARLCNSLDAVLKISNDILAILPCGSGQSVSGRPLPSHDLKPSDCDKWKFVYAMRDHYMSCVAKVEDFFNDDGIDVKVGDGEPILYIKEKFNNKERAHRACRSKLRKSRKDSKKVMISLPGNPMIRAENRLNLSGFKKALDGEWLVSRSLHEISINSYITKIEASKEEKDV